MLFLKNVMHIRRGDVTVVIRCSEMEFSLTREKGEETINGVAIFKYLGQPLEKSDNDGPVVR